MTEQPIIVDKTAELVPANSGPPKMTLGQLLDLMNRIDDGIESQEIDLNLAHLVEVKVDAYKGVMDRMDAALEILQARVKRLKSNREAIENLMARHMVQNQFERLPGVDCDAVIRWSERCIPLRDPTEADYVANSDMVRVKFEWSLSAIKDALKAGKKIDFAELIKKANLQFKVKKESK